MKVNDPNEILEWNTEKLWNAVLTIKQEIGKKPRGYDEAKNGIKINFPIHYIINEWYEMYPTTKTAKILGHGKAEITNILEEIEERNTLMRTIIKEHLDDEEPTTPRSQ